MLVVNQKIKTVYLYMALLVLVVGLIFVLSFKTQQKVPDYDVMLASSRRMEKALAAVKTYCEKNNIELEANDINKTYLLGPEYSELVTTLGYEDIKRTTINPDNAAVMASYFIGAGLKRGDVLGLGTSGSFPAFAIASLCAATELGLKTKVIASYGASMFGASRPELNIVTILHILKDNGIADFDLVAVSPGSAGDRGVGAFDGFFYENTRDLVLNLAAQSKADVIDCMTTEESVQKRLEYFGDLDCFVSVGGAIANKYLLPVYEKQGIPTFEILNVRQIALDKGLELDPSPMPECGTGMLYWQVGYSKGLIIGSLVLSSLILLCGVLKKKSSDTKK